MERLHGVSAAQLIAIQHRRAIAIEHGQIESFAVGNDAQLSGGCDRALHEREILGPIRPSRRSLIPHSAGCGPSRMRSRS